MAPIPANVLPRHVLRWREDKDWKIENGYTASMPRIVCKLTNTDEKIEIKNKRVEITLKADCSYTIFSLENKIHKENTRQVFKPFP